MLYEDNIGIIMLPEEAEELPYWEIDDREVHVFES
jgi:hypothetical protein